VEELLQPLTIEPEMASFPLRVLNDGDADPLADLRHMAARMKQHGVRPELDGSSLPMLQAALALHAEKAFASPLCFGFVLGDVKEMPDGARRLLALQQDIPDDSHWWAMKGGAHSLGLAALAVNLGGHVRTGFEDTVRDPLTGEVAASNAHLVDGLANLSSSLGRDPASPKEARQMLSLAG
jgi:3-keto-5-aminohexanoate cleavage enzyme